MRVVRNKRSFEKSNLLLPDRIVDIRVVSQGLIFQYGVFSLCYSNSLFIGVNTRELGEIV